MNMKKNICLLLTFILMTTTAFSTPFISHAAEAADSDIEGDYMEDEVLVVFEDTPSKAEVRSATAQVDATDAEEIKTTTADTPYVLTLEKGTSVEDAVEDLEKEKAVAYAQPNYLYSLDSDTDKEGLPVSVKKSQSKDMDSWSLDIIDTQKAWDLIDQIKKDGKPREKVTVAVLDTGVNLNHEDLQVALNKDKCVDVVNTDDPDQYPLLDDTSKNHGDDGGHGTLVSGIIAATSGNGGVAGIAAGNDNDLIELAVVDVYSHYISGVSRLATSADIIKGINYACDTAGAKVINMSLGHYPNEDEENSDLLLDSNGKMVTGTDKLLESTIDTAVNEKNVTIVCSAGNKNSTATWLPSDFNNTIGVISTQNYTDVFSNPKVSSSNYGWNKDISAPGYKVNSTHSNGGYTQGASGTSMAAPVVSAVAAMIYYVNPTVKASQVKSILTNTATDLYTAGDDIYTRCGNVNAYAAISMAAGYPAPAKPVYPKVTSVKAVSTGYNSVKISWKKISGVRGYRIYRSTSPNGTFRYIKSVTGENITSYTNSGLQTGTTYYYIVRAFGTKDNKKTYSPVSAVVKAKPVPAATTRFSAYSYTYQSIKLKWNKVAGATGYHLYRASSKNGTYKYIKRITKGTTTSYVTSSGLKAGRTYYYKMRPYRTVSGKRVYGAYSKIAKAKAAPKVPGLAVRKYSSKQVKVRWGKVPKVDGYIIYRATSKTGKYKRIKKVSARSSRYLIDKKVKKKKTYYYKVRAYKRIKGKTLFGNCSAAKKIRV